MCVVKRDRRRYETTQTVLDRRQKLARYVRRVNALLFSGRLHSAAGSTPPGPNRRVHSAAGSTPPAPHRQPRAIPLQHSWHLQATPPQHPRRLQQAQRPLRPGRTAGKCRAPRAGTREQVPGLWSCVATQPCRARPPGSYRRGVGPRPRLATTLQGTGGTTHVPTPGPRGLLLLAMSRRGRRDHRISGSSCLLSCGSPST